MRNSSVLLIALMLSACVRVNDQEASIANELEQSLFEYIIAPWYPRCLDTVYGGYIADFEHDWEVSESSQEKSLVNQTRHLWTTAFLYEHYPEEVSHQYNNPSDSKKADPKQESSQNDERSGLKEADPEQGDFAVKQSFLDYAEHGYAFVRNQMWDEEFGGFYHVVRRDGSVDSSTLNSKTIYGQAFAVHGLAKYYAVSGDQSALDLAIEGFRWMDRYPHEKQYGGYFEILDRSGKPTPPVTPSPRPPVPQSPLTGLKEFNSSLHVMEALTELYHVWPDSLLRERLEEMYLLFRDTFIHPDGYLRLYFYPDWTLVPDEEMRQRGGGDAWHTQHITFGHDVETAFLLLEAGHALGIANDPKASGLAKQLVDHALENGWDEENGGFWYIGYKQPDGSTTIHDNKKAFWVESEGLNALALMHTLYPEDPHDYFSKFTQLWDYIDTWLVDKDHGGWYSNGPDTAPESKTARKSNNWKTTYHDVRGMVRSIEMLNKFQSCQIRPYKISQFGK
ncbi:MAG: AGE family epimerase/isomerase [Bacteroidales bacterium]|nr:AGE family epimerase/isomerase [Bacteroidales bacterium]